MHNPGRPDNDVLDQIVAVYTEAVQTHGPEAALEGGIKAAVVLVAMMSALSAGRVCKHQAAVIFTQAVLDLSFGQVPQTEVEAPPRMFKPTRKLGEYDA